MAATLAAIGITTRDIRESVRFYRALGLDISDPEEGSPHHETTLPNGLRLMWDTADLMKQLDPDRVPPRGHRMAVAFELESPKALNDLYLDLLGAGFQGKKEPFDAFWGQRYAHVLDPDGNVVDLFSPLS